MSSEGTATDHLPPPGEEGIGHFTMSTGWCGGHGEAVLDADRRILSRDGLPIFLDDDSRQEILAAIDLSGTWRGSPVVRVSGRVRLAKRKARNSSIPGAPKESYYALVVTSLEQALVVGERGDTEPPAEGSSRPGPQ